MPTLTVNLALDALGGGVTPSRARVAVQRLDEVTRTVDGVTYIVSPVELVLSLAAGRGAFTLDAGYYWAHRSGGPSKLIHLDRDARLDELAALDPATLDPADPATVAAWADRATREEVAAAAELAADAIDEVAASTTGLRATPAGTTATLRRVTAALTSYDDVARPPLRVVGLGSSVAAGATLPDPGTQSPVAHLAAQLLPVLDRTGGVAWVVSNGAVNGSAVIDGYASDYATATAGGAPTLVVLGYGMNDGAPGLYHAGQTYPGFLANLRGLIDKAHADGADVIVLTTPHPHTGRDVLTVPNGVPVSYAGSGAGPSATIVPEPLDAVVQVTAPSGATVPANWRYLRINEAMRQVADDTGSLLIDAERAWFDAVAAFGEDALFDEAERLHPNLLGHRSSYWAAIDDYVAGLRRATAQGVGASKPPYSRGEVIGGRVGLGPGGSATIVLPANTRGMLAVWGTSGGGWQSHSIAPVVTDSTRVGVAEPWGTFTAPGDLVAGIAGSGDGSLTATITTTNTGGGAILEWEYSY